MLALLDLQFRGPVKRAVTEKLPPPLPPLPRDGHSQERLLENRHFRPVLVASKPGHMKARRPFGGSLLTHIGMGALIIMVTQPGPPRPVGAGDTTLIFLPLLQAAERPALPAPTQQIGGGGGGGGAGPMLVVANPPPKGFQTVSAPILVPTSLPSVNLNERALDPRDYTGIGVEGGVSYGVVGGTGKVDPAMAPGPGPVREGAVYSEVTPDASFIKAQLVHQVAPVYPAALRMAGIQGSVVVRFVIDTLGNVEPASVQVLESTRASFDQPAMDAILATRFNPARLGSRKVRQLTNQRITFRLAGGSDPSLPQSAP